MQQAQGETVRSPSATHQVDTPASEFLIFRLGEESCGIEILKVQEIRGYETPTVIANAPAFIKGVINLRGVIVPVLDLRIKFRLRIGDFRHPLHHRTGIGRRPDADPAGHRKAHDRCRHGPGCDRSALEPGWNPFVNQAQPAPSLRKLK